MESSLLLERKSERSCQGDLHCHASRNRKLTSRLTAIASAEAAKTAREEARNILEGYLYKLSNMLDPETDRRAIQDFSTPAERDVMSKLVAETFDWLSEHAETANEKELRAKRIELE